MDEDSAEDEDERFYQAGLGPPPSPACSPTHPTPSPRGVRHCRFAGPMLPCLQPGQVPGTPRHGPLRGVPQGKVQCHLHQTMNVWATLQPFPRWQAEDLATQGEQNNLKSVSEEPTRSQYGASRTFDFFSRNTAFFLNPSFS